MKTLVNFFLCALLSTGLNATTDCENFAATLINEKGTSDPVSALGPDDGEFATIDKGGFVFVELDRTLNKGDVIEIICPSDPEDLKIILMSCTKQHIAKSDTSYIYDPASGKIFYTLTSDNQRYLVLRNDGSEPFEIDAIAYDCPAMISCTEMAYNEQSNSLALQLICETKGKAEVEVQVYSLDDSDTEFEFHQSLTFDRSGSVRNIQKLLPEGFKGVSGFSVVVYSMGPNGSLTTSCSSQFRNHNALEAGLPSISISPNPANEYTMLTLSGFKQGEYSLNIFQTNNSQIRGTQKLYLSPVGEYRSNINTSHYPTGSYYLEVRNSATGDTEVGSFVVSR